MEILEQLKNPPQFENKIVLALTIDRGGKQWPSRSTKVGLIIANNAKPNSPYNVQLLAIYDGDDNYETMKSMLALVILQLKRLNSIKFKKEGGWEQEMEIITYVNWFFSIYK
jgi:hypothetical protein